MRTDVYRRGYAAGLAAAADYIERRASSREAQVKVAIENGGAHEAVSIKAGELRAVAPLVRCLPVLGEAADVELISR